MVISSEVVTTQVEIEIWAFEEDLEDYGMVWYGIILHTLNRLVQPAKHENTSQSLK